LITLTDERGLIYSPKSWDEILAIPGYVRGLDPARYKLKAVIGSYHLKDIHCGLSCNAEHDKGVIAQFHGGAVTNVGHICGKKHFDVDFTTFTNQYNRDVVAKTYRDLLSTFSFQLDDLENEINDLREPEFGIGWIYKTTQNLINNGKECPDEVVRAIQTMIKSGTNILQKERLASDAEIKALELSQAQRVKKPHYIQEDIAVIFGLEALFPENDLRKLVTIEIEENIKAFKKLTIDKLTHSELSRWGKWVSSLESTKDRLKVSMQAGSDLLKSSNLKPFREILSKRVDFAAFDKFLKKLPT
jgi:hypothetical protein